MLLAAVMLIGAFLVRESTYQTLYRTFKYVDLNFLLIGLLIYAGFALGSSFTISAGAASRERDMISYCRWVLLPLFGLTVSGYTVWFALAMVQSGGPGQLLNIGYEVFFSPSVGLADYVRFELFGQIPGITTLTQLGILYATVEALLWVRGASNRRFALVRIAVVLSLTLVRALLVSERLALVEIAVPVIVVLALEARRRGIYGRLISVAPFLMGFGVFVLFASGEYFRSWRFYQNLYAGSYLEFAFERFLGYYTTAVNNAAVFYYHEPVHPLLHSLRSVFDFPVLGEVAVGLYEPVFGDIGDVTPLLETYANPEFNNIAPVGLLLNEYTLFAAPVAAFLLGIVATSLYNSYLKGQIVGMLLYPSWFIGLLELSRVYYWPGGRYFPVLAFLLISLVLFRIAKTPVRSPIVPNHPRRANLERR